MITNTVHLALTGWGFEGPGGILECSRVLRSLLYFVCLVTHISFCSPNQTKTNLKLQRLDYLSLITEFDSHLPRYVFLFFIIACQKWPDCTGIQRAINVFKFPYERLTEWVVSQRFTSHMLLMKAHEIDWSCLTTRQCEYQETLCSSFFDSAEVFKWV